MEKQVNTLLVQYVREWERIGRTKACPEASDTAVREVVGWLFDQLREKSGVDAWSLKRWSDLY